MANERITLNDYEYLVKSREAMFDHLGWWGKALKSARQKAAAESIFCKDRNIRGTL
jgi:hypothetical protein